MGGVVKGVGKAIGKVGKGVGKLIGFDTDAIAKAGERQAEATLETAKNISDDAHQKAVQAQRTQESTMAREAAAEKAKSLLDSAPAQKIDVAVAGPDDDVIDPETGKRIRTRDTYANSQSSINI